MLKAGNNLRQGLLPEMLHVTCFSNAPSRVCEGVRMSYPKIDKIVTNLKNVLARSPRRAGLMQELTGCKVPTFPVNTRWGTWVRFCHSVLSNIDSMRKFCEKIFAEDCASIGPLMRWMNASGVPEELCDINQLQILPDFIENREERNLTIGEQKLLIEKIRIRIPARFKEKLDNCISKNPSYLEIFELREQLSRLNYNYAPLTSIEVERTFSQFKYILTD